MGDSTCRVVPQCKSINVLVCFASRYKGRIGMAPASMLALTETHLNVPKEYQFALTVVRILTIITFRALSDNAVQIHL